MTDTSDLVERLNAESKAAASCGLVRISAMFAEAATALTAKDKEIEALRERVHYAEGTADLAMQHRDQAEARAETAEKEIEALKADFAKLSEMAKESERLRSGALDVAEQMQARAETAERERDEARAALKPFADVSGKFLFAVGPDGIDDALTVVVYAAVQEDQKAHLSTADFRRAARAVTEQGE